MEWKLKLASLLGKLTWQANLASWLGKPTWQADLASTILTNCTFDYVSQTLNVTQILIIFYISGMKGPWWLTNQYQQVLEEKNVLAEHLQAEMELRPVQNSLSEISQVTYVFSCCCCFRCCCLKYCCFTCRSFIKLSINCFKSIVFSPG